MWDLITLNRIIIKINSAAKTIWEKMQLWPKVEPKPDDLVYTSRRQWAIAVQVHECQKSQFVKSGAGQFWANKGDYIVKYAKDYKIVMSPQLFNIYFMP